MTLDWKPGADAPDDGTPFWAWVNEGDIQKVEYRTPAQNAAWENGDPDNYLGGFVSIKDNFEVVFPKWWVPIDAISFPPTP